jgi:tetratricopeptide (TPR) repeat protein
VGIPREKLWEIDHHLANAYQFMGRNREAKKLYQEASTSYAETFRKRDAVYATIVHAIADVCGALGENDEAEKLYEQAMKLYDNDPGKYFERHAECLLSLYEIREVQGREEEAKEYARRAQEECKTAVGDQDPIYAEFLHRLANAQYKCGRIEEAEAVFGEALILRKKILTDRHPTYADTLLEVSICQRLQPEGKMAAAIGFGTTVAIYENTLGPEHPKLGKALHFQASLWMENPQRRPTAARQLDLAIKILEDALGAGHEWTVNARADRDKLRSYQN